MTIIWINQDDARPISNATFDCWTFFYLCLILILLSYHKPLATRSKVNGTLIVQVLKVRFFTSSRQFGMFVNASFLNKHLQMCQIVNLKEKSGLSVPGLWVCHLFYLWLLKTFGSSVKLESSINKNVCQSNGVLEIGRALSWFNHILVITHTVPN